MPVYVTIFSNGMGNTRLRMPLNMRNITGTSATRRATDHVNNHVLPRKREGIGRRLQLDLFVDYGGNTQGSRPYPVPSQS